MSSNPSDLFDLTGKTAIITGGSRGIGFAIAETFLNYGANVVISSRKQENLDSAVQHINANSEKIVAIAAHTGDPKAANHLVERTLEVFGGIDILVNNAATNPHFGPFLTASENQWDKIIDVNLKGYFRMAKAIVPEMKKRGGGKIINISSVAGTKPMAGMGVYCVSKAGVIMMTEVLAGELAKENIQVNTIAPGLIDTKFSAAFKENKMLLNQVLKDIPQGRIGEVHELTGLALYLASKASSFTTGSTFIVDGGQVVSTGMMKF